MRDHRVDKILLILTLGLLLGGFFIFMSASLGLLARGGATFGVVAFNQAFFGLLMGSIALWYFSRTSYKVWKKYALYVFLASLFLTALVFVPFLGFSHGGAQRWLSFGPLSLQPAEFLKLGVVVYLAAWFSHIKDKIHTIKWGIIPLFVVVGLVGAILLLQPDTGTFLVISVTAVAMFLIAGGRWKHIIVIFLIACIGLATLVVTKPYIKERVLTFVDPSRDSLGAGWQIQQSLIAVGSGGVFGKGFGQSVQKFSFLPEPIGDSIFAVAAEEFGFLGGIVIISTFILFLLRGLYIARRAPDNFSGLLASGVVIMIVVQVFLNIGAIVGVLPLTGLPLTFVSKGGTALLFALIGVGIVLNISRYKRNI